MYSSQFNTGYGSYSGKIVWRERKRGKELKIVWREGL
jgi:hypothetical protein